MEPIITISTATEKDSEAAIFAALKAYNLDRFGPSDWQELTISLRDGDGKVTGGLCGHTARGWLYTSLLFIPEDIRGQGLGARLLAMAEDEARKRGCKGAYIDTMSPDALAVYQKSGYEIFGQIEDFSDTVSLTYLKKSFLSSRKTIMADSASFTPFTFAVGTASITAFCDGVLVVPVRSLYRLHSDLPTPENFPEAPSELSVNAFLVQADGRNVMIDAGSGAFFGPEHGKLQSALSAYGVSPDDIDDIILTHIHADHSGGLIIDDKPVFKKAQLHIGKTEAAFWLADGAADGPNVSEKVKGQITRAHAAIDPYTAENRVTLFEDNGDILPGFRASLRNGHTPGHLSIRFETSTETIVFVGDIVHGNRVQFANPAITIDFDYDQPNAAIARAAAFAQAADEGYLIAAAHLPFPGIGHVRRDGENYRFEAYSTQ